MKEILAPPPPPPKQSRRKRPSAKSVSSTPKSSVPSTPAASEVGSTVSSMFLKPFSGFFGKKKTASEAGYDDEASSHVKGQNSESETSGYSTEQPKAPDTKASTSAGDVQASEGKPPMPGRRGSERKGKNAISGGKDERYAPSTYSIPPPKHIPSTPGSEAPSDFGSVAATSVFSTGVASSTFNPVAHSRALRRTQKNTAPLGANFDDMPIYYEEDEVESAVGTAVTSFAAQPRGYDVFAPPGPLGMVVDTVEKGCIVHSSKKSSPMQGLINRGDLIIALDDFDVREMGAAALTKLMAKMSQQKERKLTLISADEY